MKRIILYIALATLTANSFAQGGHFVSTYDANAPFYMSLKVIAATINGSVLEAGDEIAVFDGTICCNKVILNGPIITTDINSYKELSASKAYETHPLGYTPGHTITYKIWDASNSLEISGITAQYIDPASGSTITAPTFTDDASAFVKLSITVVINQAPIANAGPDQTVKEGTVVTLDGSSSSDPESKPLSYAWSAPSGITLSSSTQAKPTFTAPEVTVNTNYSFSLLVNDGVANSTTDQVVVTVQDCTPAAPTVGAITQPSCSTATGSVALSGLPASGTWTLTRSPGGTTTTGSGTNSTISSLPAGTHTFTVTNVSGCISPSSANVVINTQATTPTAPTVGAITQPSCSTATGSVALSGLPASGTWTLTRSPGGTITTGSGTNSTISSLPAGTYTFTVTNVSGCISAASANVVINAQPTTPTAPTVGSITQPSCSTATGSVALSGLPASGTWTLTRSPGGTTTTGSGTNSTISSLPAGTYTFTVTNVSGCISPASANVVINAQPSTPAAPTVGIITQPSCSTATGSVALSGLPASGTWTLTRSPGGTTTTGSGTSSTISLLPAGTYTFTVTNVSGCISPASANVVINAQPTTPTAPTVGAITQPSCAVATGSVALSGLPASGTWTLTRSPGGTTTTGSGTSSTISSLPAGTHTFTVTNVSGCISPASSNVVINAQPTTPAAPTVGVITQPSITQPTGSVVLNGLPATGTWILTRSPGGITTTGTGTNTTVSFLNPGIYQYTATNSSGCISPVSANVFINGIPSANAGTDQSINEGTLVTLDGSASSDPDNNALTYTWSAPQGITLSSNTVAKPTFTAPEVMTNQNYTFSLTVNDGTTNSAIDQVFITVKQVNKAPIANAGTDQSVEKNTLYTLDGTASSDPDGDPLTYLWTAPPGISLSSNSVASPTFTTPSSATITSYTFTLTVSDSKLTSLSDQVVITIKQTNQTPLAKAGNDQTVDEGGLVTLDGSLSSDPDGDALVYSWVAPSGITLSLTTAAKPTFTAPEVLSNQAYTFSLTVNDGTVTSAADQVTITVKQVNKAPVANAGNDQVVIEGSSVTLNGSTSYDPESSAISYSWSAPPGITLSSTTIINPKFTAPEVLADQDLVFSLIVNDGTLNSIADQVIVKVKQVNKVPVSNAGSNQIMNEGAIATLDGSASSDPDNNKLTYLWTAPAGITLSSVSDVKPTFLAPEVKTDQIFTFSLVVNDGIVNSTTAQVLITVKQVNKAPILTSAKSFFAKVGTQQDFLMEGADIDNDPISFTIENLPSFLKLTKNTNTSALLSGTFASQFVGNNTFSLTLSDGALSTHETITISVSSTDTAPYVKDSIKNISVNKGAADIIIDLKNVFADNDQGDILNFSVTSNTNGQVVAAKITGSELTLSFSTQYNGLSQITITASSNGKEAQSKFNVEVKISTGIGLPDEDNGLLVYPNPTEGEIHLKIDRISKDGIWINVYNESGKLISRSLIRNNEENLNLKGNVPGIYFIQIDQKNKKAYKVVLK